MTSRETIFKRIEDATKGLEDNTALPSVEDIWSVHTNLVPSSDDVDTLTKAFAARFAEVNGKVLFGWEALGPFLQERGVKNPYLDPKVASEYGRKADGFLTSYPRSGVDEIDCGITLASMGIAEQGSLVLKDCDTTNRLSALAPWVHVAVLSKDKIVPSLLGAIRAFGDDPSIIFVTGPSKTADIEGVLIEGVHGPGIQACLLV